ncbi:permease protein [Alicycliphilus sp. B1]|nr:permease protein [Alicycliphilus sp. B1]
MVLVFFLVELFDATGTLMGVAKRAGLLVPGRMERPEQVAARPTAAPIFAGALLGTSEHHRLCGERRRRAGLAGAPA